MAKKNKVTDPMNQVNQIQTIDKYKIGLQCDNLSNIKHLKPIFAYDYISLKKTKFCFNSSLIDRNDYSKYFEGLKKLSSFSYEILSKEKKLFIFTKSILMKSN